MSHLNLRIKILRKTAGKQQENIFKFVQGRINLKILFIIIIDASN